LDISLSGDGFALTLPSGRKLSIPNTPHASGFIFRILWDATHGEQRKGYIGSYPTQAAVDIWQRDATRAERKAEQDEWLQDAAENKQQAALAALGVTLDELDIQL
jgi:hypothetical protein